MSSLPHPIGDGIGRTVPDESRHPDWDGDRQSDDGSLLSFVNVLLRYRGQIALVVLACVALAVTLALAWEERYTVQASFTPQSRRPTSNVSAIALQLGLNLPNAEVAQSPAFYADLLGSRTILRQAVLTRYEIPTAGSSRAGSLVALYDVAGRNDADRIEKAIRRLEKSVRASVVQKTGVVVLRVSSADPALSHQLAQRLLDLVNAFNLETRQSQAGAERRFTEARLAEARRELRDVEDRLQSFLQRNRGYSDSPELRFQAERLQREVTMRQQVYTTLTQAFEQARIEEVRDTPVITVIDRPLLPARPDSRRLILVVLGALAAGTVIGIAIALIRALLSRSRATRPSAFEEFVALRRDALNDVRHPVRALRRTLSRSPARAR